MKNFGCQLKTAKGYMIFQNTFRTYMTGITMCVDHCFTGPSHSIRGASPSRTTWGGWPPFKTCRFLGSALQTKLLDSGWAPTKSIFNMPPRWFSCKPTFQKQDCRVEGWGKSIWQYFSHGWRGTHLPLCFLLGRSRSSPSRSTRGRA